MTNNSRERVDEILRCLEMNFDPSNPDTEFKYQQAKAAILALLLSEMPEEKKVHLEMDYLQTEEGEARLKVGFNEARTTIIQKLKEMFL